MADALFRINGDDSNQGYDADPLEVLALALKTQPVSGVSTVRFQIWDAALFDPDLDIVRNPPRKAKLSPALLFDNGDETGSSLSPVTVGGQVTLTMPADRFHAWLIRCVVNGGMIALADGRVIPDPSLIHERMIVVKDVDGNRPIVATETTQYEDDGWAPQVGLSGAVGATGATGATGPTGATGATGAASALRLIRTEIFRVGSSLETITNGVSVFTSASTWSPNASDGNLYKAWVHASGPGGGSSSRGQTGQGRGQGGSGGGACQERVYDRTYINAVIAALGTPIPITVGAKGTGGAAGTSGASNQNGVNGNPGALSSFGSLLIAHPGGIAAGASGTTVGGGGGGSLSAGVDGTSASITAASGQAGRPMTANGSSQVNRDGSGGGGGRGGDSGVATLTVGWAEWGGGGGAGGNGSVAAGEVGNPGGRSLFGGGGSGAGGGCGALTGQGRAGGAGGGTGPLGTNGGSAGSAGNNGGNGGDGVIGHYGGAGGGGGGARNSLDGASPGAGGNGGFPGGAGGSGGACHSAGGNIARSAGGDGGDGVVAIYTYG